MGDPVLIGIRFALYANLMLVVGLAALPLYSMTRGERRGPEPMATIWRLERWLCATGLILSTLGMGVLVASMQGVSPLSLEFDAFRGLVQETDVGAAWIYRSAALLVALATAIWLTSWPTVAAVLVAASGSVAVATLAWSGHAAATEGTAGPVHLLSDILHMIAAAIWIGAIGGFLILISPHVLRQVPDGQCMATRSLDQFSRIGTVCVLVIGATGLINSQMIVGIDHLAQLPASPYGQLLLAKLALFGLMLVLAAANRWRLIPRLAIAVAHSDAEPPDAPLAAIRRSLFVEAAAALVILALVGWLGTLEPLADGA